MKDIRAKNGNGREAIEIALWHANEEIVKDP